MVMAEDSIGDFWSMAGPEVSWVHRQLRRLGVHPNDLEDVTQEVLFAVCRKWAHYDPSRALRPWRFAFVYREASAYRRKYEPEAGTPGIEPDEASEAMPADALIEQQQAKTLVLDAIASIDLDRRAVFIMVDIEGVPVPDVAGSLCIPLNTAYSRLRVAREEFAAAVRRLTAKLGRP
ncbi:MAG: sigma-70 family RNA polymerase sigma factor [Deltaproteobacteria bacterium]